MTYVIKTTSSKFFRRHACWTERPNPSALFTTDIHSAKQWLSKSAAQAWLRARCERFFFDVGDYTVEEVT